MKKKPLMFFVLALPLLLQGCVFFTGRDDTNSSPITISDDRIHYHHKRGFTPDPHDAHSIVADETSYAAKRIIVRNCPMPPCAVDLDGGPWSAAVLDQSGSQLDQITATTTTVTVKDGANDDGFKQDADDPTTGKGYYHDPPNGGTPVLVGSVQVTVGNGTPTSLQCPSTNCQIIAQYCRRGSPDPSNDYKCK